MPVQTQNQKHLIKATLQLASFGFSEADPDDMDFTALMKQVEKKYAVVIHIDADNNSLDIQGPSKDSASRAMDHIRSALKLEAGGAKVWHPAVLMGPTSLGKSGFLALLEHEEDEGARPYMSSNAGPIVSRIERDLIHARWLNDFRQMVSFASKEIRRNPSEMRMRVQFGRLLLQEWKKDVAAYTYDDLESVIKRLGSRGTFSFSQMLGNAQLARNLLAKIYESPGSFEPGGNRTGTLRNIPPKHSLIITTNNLKIEAEVISVQETDTSKSVLRLGTARGYRLERRSKAVEIAASCPELKYDWNLAVHTRVPVESLPFSHNDLNKYSRLSPQASPDMFPHITMGGFADIFKVGQVLAKTAWTFKIRDSCYSIEVAMYNVIAGAVPDAMREGGCGVDFFRPAWDEVLGFRDALAGPRPIGPECKELFPFVEKRLTDQDGIQAFARRVEQIQRLISGTHEEQRKAHEKQNKEEERREMAETSAGTGRPNNIDATARERPAARNSSTTQQANVSSHKPPVSPADSVTPKVEDKEDDLLLSWD